MEKGEKVGARAKIWPAKECEAVARNRALTRLCTCVSCNGRGRSFQAVRTNTSPSSSEQPNK